MKNLIAELLVRLVEKEEESKELVARVEALEIVMTALLRRVDGAQLQQIADSITMVTETASGSYPASPEDASLPNTYIQRLLTAPRS